MKIGVLDHLLQAEFFIRLGLPNAEFTKKGPTTAARNFRHPSRILIKNQFGFGKSELNKKFGNSAFRHTNYDVFRFYCNTLIVIIFILFVKYKNYEFTFHIEIYF